MNIDGYLQRGVLGWRKENHGIDIDCNEMNVQQYGHGGLDVGIADVIAYPFYNGIFSWRIKITVFFQIALMEIGF